LYSEEVGDFWERVEHRAREILVEFRRAWRIAGC